MTDKPSEGKCPFNHGAGGGTTTQDWWPDQLKVELLQAILRHKIHGISFSAYVDGQSPGTEISEHQIRERLSIISPYTHWIRSFSCREGNQETARVAHENGLKTMVGVGLSDDLDLNEIELRNGIEVARAGHADILAVGNEVMLREDLTEDQLIEKTQFFQ